MRPILSLLLAVTLNAEIVDRVAIRIGNQVITELQIDEDLRVTALLNQTAVPRSITARRDASDRLIEQFLIKREIDVSRYPPPPVEDVSKYIGQTENEIAGQDTLKQRLRKYAITEDTLAQHLAWQLTALRFVEYRFGSDLAVTGADVRSYYSREVEQAKATHTPPPPPFEAAQESIHQILVEERTNEALNSWLEEARKRFNIVYLDRSLQ